MKIVSLAIPKIEFPKNQLQSCPFCKTKHPIIICGQVKHPETQKISLVSDKGYSFCNCKNIWYTDWKNIDLDIYDDLYFEKYQIESTKLLFEKYASEYFPKIKDITNVSKFTEIGSIESTVLDCAKEQGWITTGVDINPKTSNINHFKIVGNIEDFNTYKKVPKSDVFWMSHIFEHFKNPLIILENIINLLNDGGVLFVSMPDPYFIDWHNAYSFPHFCLREHHTLWDMDSFISEAEKLGMKLVFKQRNISQGFICNLDYHILLQKV